MTFEKYNSELYFEIKDSLVELSGSIINPGLYPLGGPSVPKILIDYVEVFHLMQMKVI